MIRTDFTKANPTIRRFPRVGGEDGAFQVVDSLGSPFDRFFSKTPNAGVKSILTDGTIDAAFTYFHQDRLNNVYMVSDEAGKAAEYYDYTAYGVRTIRSAQGSYSVRSNLGTAFGYQGQRHDQETGLVHMRVRVYKPDWGRFLSPDPIGLLGGSNLFAFVESAPLKYTDPFGLSPQSPQSSRSSANWFWKPSWARSLVSFSATPGW